MLSARRVLVVVGLLATLAAPGTVQAAAPITVQVLVGDTCVTGTAGANKSVSATLKTPSGHQRDQFTTVADSTGEWFGCFSLFLPSSTINGGDILKVTAGASSRTIQVPRLTPLIDRVANTISGRATANTQVDVYVTHHPTFRRSRDFTFRTVADSQGAWSVNTTNVVNLIGEDEITVITAVGTDLFGAIALVPYVLLQHVNNVVEGGSNIGVNVTFTLLDRHGVLKGQGATGTTAYGIFEAGLFGASGDPAYPVGGDRLVSDLAADASLRVPVSGLHGDATADVVAGRCMANAPYLLITANRTYYGRTDATGRVTRSVALKENLRRGDELRLACMYRTGDVWVRTGIAS